MEPVTIIDRICGLLSRDEQETLRAIGVNEQALLIMLIMKGYNIRGAAVGVKALIKIAENDPSPLTENRLFGWLSKLKTVQIKDNIFPNCPSRSILCLDDLKQYVSNILDAIAHNSVGQGAIFKLADDFGQELVDWFMGQDDPGLYYELARMNRDFAEKKLLSVMKTKKKAPTKSAEQGPR